MWALLTAVIVFCLSFILGVLSMRSDLDVLPGIFGTTLIVSLIVLVIQAFCLINKEARFDSIIADYENTKALVESYSGNDYGNMQSLTEKVIKINERIADHKAYCHCKWNYIFYSERVGNLEPIVFNKPRE